MCTCKCLQPRQSSLGFEHSSLYKHAGQEAGASRKAPQGYSGAIALVSVGMLAAGAPVQAACSAGFCRLKECFRRTRTPPALLASPAAISLLSSGAGASRCAMLRSRAMKDPPLSSGLVPEPCRLSEDAWLSPLTASYLLKEC